eukprot:m.139109 g.139109  ORF g.139109 m.139109 type:complete len:52 (+) comp30034_c0_seq1:256-411(+)
MYVFANVYARVHKVVIDTLTTFGGCVCMRVGRSGTRKHKKHVDMLFTCVLW